MKNAKFFIQYTPYNMYHIIWSIQYGKLSTIARFNAFCPDHIILDPPFLHLKLVLLIRFHFIQNYLIEPFTENPRLKNRSFKPTHWNIQKSFSIFILFHKQFFFHVFLLHNFADNENMFYKNVFSFRICIRVTILPQGILNWNFQLIASCRMIHASWES